MYLKPKIVFYHLVSSSRIANRIMATKHISSYLFKCNLHIVCRRSSVLYTQERSKVNGSWSEEGRGGVAQVECRVCAGATGHDVNVRAGATFARRCVACLQRSSPIETSTHTENRSRSHSKQIRSHFFTTSPLSSRSETWFLSEL